MLQSRREWYDIFKLMKTKDPQARICYPQGSHSNFTEKSKLYSLQTSKAKRKNSSPPSQFTTNNKNELLQVRKQEKKKKKKGEKGEKRGHN